MTTRTDLTADFYSSPRVLEIASPSTEIIAQDTLDTLRKIEDTFEGMSFEKLINSSGKDDLGGGVLVGITNSLQNAVLAFEARTTPAETGTVTTGSSAPVGNPPTISFIDTAADFVTAGVAKGSLVINFDDQSIADVFEVVSATELKTKPLVNGISNTFTIGDVYHVFNIVQVRVTGGNHVAVDENGDPLNSPVLPTAFTQVFLTSSSSATLQELQDIQHSSFEGGVTVDVNNETGLAAAGTAFPSGTKRQPVNNFSDAIIIANARGFDTFFIIGDVTIGAGLNFSNKRLIGQGPNLSTFTIDASSNVLNCTFAEASITGTLDGDCHIERSIITDLSVLFGVIEDSIINPGTITLGGSGTAHFINCASGVPGTSTPIIDMGGSGQALAMRNYSGGIRIQNKTGPEDVSLDLDPGDVFLSASVGGAGTIKIRGVGTVTNEGATATVEDHHLLNHDAIWSHVVDGPYTAEQILRVLLAAQAGKLSGADTGNIAIRDASDTKDRITATTDANGNRTSVTIDAT